MYRWSALIGCLVTLAAEPPAGATPGLARTDEDASDDAEMVGLDAGRRALYRGERPEGRGAADLGRGSGRRPLGSGPSTGLALVSADALEDLVAARASLVGASGPLDPATVQTVRSAGSPDAPGARRVLQEQARACVRVGRPCPTPAVLRPDVGLLGDKRTVAAADDLARARAWIWTAHDRLLRELRTQGRDPEDVLPPPSLLVAALADPAGVEAMAVSLEMASLARDHGVILAPWPAPGP